MNIVQMYTSYTMRDSALESAVWLARVLFSLNHFNLQKWLEENVINIHACPLHLGTKSVQCKSINQQRANFAVSAGVVGCIISWVMCEHLRANCTMIKWLLDCRKLCGKINAKVYVFIIISSQYQQLAC